jgi:hypothetical protein
MFPKIQTCGGGCDCPATRNDPGETMNRNIGSRTIEFPTDLRATRYMSRVSMSEFSRARMKNWRADRCTAGVKLILGRSHTWSSAT